MFSPNSSHPSGGGVACSRKVMQRYKFCDQCVYFITYRVKDSLPLLQDSACKEILLKRINDQIEVFADDQHFAFSILDTHWHMLALVKEKEKFSRALQMVLGGSARYINLHLKRSGELWPRHFVRPVFTEDSVSRVMGYVLGNPIRHGKVSNFDELYQYKFSNFHEFCDRVGKDAMCETVMQVLKLKVYKPDEEKFWSEIYGEDI